MVDLVIATRNRHKVRELKQLLNVRGIRWHSLVEFPHVAAVDETGRTFDANAIKKACAVAAATGHLALADDSGLEVEALGGAPGVRSARFAGRHGNDRANNERLLHLLKETPARQRRARYQCSLALAGASPSRLLALTHGTWSGVIDHVPRGRNGFGYDPIFLVPRLGKTVGQLSIRLKHRLSHRAQAARRMQRVLARLVARAPATGRRRGGFAASRLARGRMDQRDRRTAWQRASAR